MTWDRVEEGGGGKDTIPAVPITSIEEFASAARGGANSISFTSHAKEDTGRSWIDTLAHLQNKSIPVHLPLRKMVPNQYISSFDETIEEERSFDMILANRIVQ
ncbi:hypothetical protein V1477_015151 [Vespula maculifrons]|uniref:Uncharacterized protein n=1 Tax=Vespula maculifrons TaxID=7453 RepID=A0ABD2BJX7_VESMC